MMIEKDWMGINFPGHRIYRAEVRDKFRKKDWGHVKTIGLKRLNTVKSDMRMCKYL